MNKVSVEIDSKVNEIFAKTIVVQKFKNQSESPIELKIYVYKNDNLIFSSFTSKIGDSITVKSKVIKKEKAEIKYTDSISSGNAAIFVAEDPYDKERIIINMGNIPANEEVIFTSEYIQFVETSKLSEFEIFRNLPIFQGKSEEFHNQSLKGTINIQTQNKILKIDKNILMKELKINEEKYINEEKNNYFISYEIAKLPTFSKYNRDNYIPSSKIYFELDLNQNLNEPLVYCQKSLLNSDELNYIINYTYQTKKTNEDLEISPGLFIFLIDQSGSMSGSSIEIASKGLKLFLQSLPPKSYYQIIGFGSDFKAYDKTPKQYTQENILKSIMTIDNLRADLGGTDIYSPLKYVYDSYKEHDKINLPRNIFLLTDGEIEDKKRTLDLIYNNSSKYSIYSIGIGKYFDEDLIKNAGIIGKGGYNFCKDMEQINSTIVKEINKATSHFCSDINIKTSLDDKNLVKNKLIPNVLIDNQNINLYYIINNKEINDIINIEVNYLENEEKIEKKYEIAPKFLPEGEELSKLIINSYLNDNNLEEEKETKMALKYQIFRKNTSLFAEIELSDKVTEKMKEEIIGNKENNQIKISKMDDLHSRNIFSMGMGGMNLGMGGMNPGMGGMNPMMMNNMNSMNMGMGGMNMGMGGMNMGMGGMNPGMGSMNLGMSGMNPMMGGMNPGMGNMNSMNPVMCGMNPMMMSNMNSMNNMCQMPMLNKSMNQMNPMMNSNNTEKEDKKKTINIKTKNDIMKIINTQDFVNGFWEVNEYTKIIKEKYQKEYDILIKNITNEKVVITILMVYFINKEHPELLDELLMIIKKAKLFIKKETKDSYENIIKQI